MLSDEEKKAIDDIKRELTDEDRREYMNKWFADDLQILVNLIDKQSKEIEELKKPKYVINCKTNEITKLTNDFVSKDKIKAKIEEINKEMLNEENSLELFYRKKYCKEVLQSLLEKE